MQDSKRDIEDTVYKSAELYMKTEKNGPWTVRNFKLLSEDLAYFGDGANAEREGQVSLKDAGSSVILLKPEQAGSETVYPIKLKLQSGQQFYVGTSTKKDRKDWAAIINGRVSSFCFVCGCV